MTTDVSWLERAACRGHSTDDFYPPSPGHGRPDDGHGYAAVRLICAGCPVRCECLDEVMRLGDEHGFRGGKSPNQRRVLARSRRENRVA